MSGAWTKGPWRVSRLGLTNDGKRPVTAEDAGIAWVHSQSEFKRSDGWRHECAEREANAHLIAAAPDMAEALEKALNFITNTESEMGETLPCGDAARAALAKARGEA